MHSIYGFYIYESTDYDRTRCSTVSEPDLPFKRRGQKGR